MRKAKSEEEEEEEENGEGWGGGVGGGGGGTLVVTLSMLVARIPSYLATEARFEMNTGTGEHVEIHKERNVACLVIYT